MVAIHAENTLVAVGDPVNEILREAEEGGYDLVVMGTHDHGKVEETLIGSVAREVIRACEVPVMVGCLPKGPNGAKRTTVRSSGGEIETKRKIVSIGNRKVENRESG